MSSDDDMDIISSSSEDEDGEELELFLWSIDDNEEDRNSEKGDEMKCGKKVPYQSSPGNFRRWIRGRRRQEF